MIRARAAAASRGRIARRKEGRFVSAHPSHLSAASPLSAKRARPLKGRVRPPGDKSISHRAFLFGLLDLRRNEGRGAARGRRRAWHRQGLPGARRGRSSARRRAHGEFAAPGSARSCRRAKRSISATPAPAPADDGRRRRPRNHRDLRRRRLAAQAADAAHPRSAQADGRPGSVRGRRRALPDRAQGRPRSRADRISHARRLGADQIGRPARRPQRAGRDDRDRRRRPRATIPRRCSPISAPRSRFTPEGEGRRITLVGRPELRPATVVVPADPSSAAFPIVAALIVPGSDIVVEGDDDEPAQDRASRRR